MKGLLGGICAGVVVGVIGLAVGLSLAPVRDHQAIGGRDRPAAVGPETQSIFADEPGTAPVARDDARVGLSPADDPSGDIPAATTPGQTVRQESDVRVPEAAVAPPSEGAEPAAPAATVSTVVVNAAELGPDAEARVEPAEAEPATTETPTVDPAAEVVPPAAQILAPRAPNFVPAQTDGPGLTRDPAEGPPRDGLEAQPAALVVPEAGFAPPDFDGGLPSRPERLPQDVDEAATADDRPALVRNAIAEPPSWYVPLMAIVVVDRAGTDPIEGVPLSVAIAADAADAEARAEAWRAAGAEIVAIPGPPTGAAGTGPLAMFDALPRAATVMAQSERGFAGGSIAADEIAAVLAETGHGLILRSGTSTSVIEAAERAGVPAVEIFRRVDGSGRDGRAVGRFLDQAAFEARNRGAVVVIADNSPETAEGLERFLGSSRADSVALVPVSAILRAQ
ncbi:Uncharacterized conserved protein YibQ, putative polysaccharide deacetylase 2 family [Palleronia marisminoris]|uniref:Divergent polysaccharide deacetylase n=1 Tax=Palleronia marisminoris TaxID=315423 RepID=A0A1Y5T8X3_9RHOB|nr:divergent polysaccharide deacetylase family protein [Palleronia marisminoris]SFH23260.1 Uncharacterized conserved protein YibQ, putative polysaccharide deacetylase 2 family [Palleronia marisminoris]SLN58413.1 Divergent polysaccharide deacetylase [Palleronia marisminoris]